MIDRLPVVHLEPVEKDKKVPTKGFSCPLYKLQGRKQEFGSVGNAPTIVTYFDLPSKEESTVWVKNDVSAFLSLKQ